MPRNTAPASAPEVIDVRAALVAAFSRQSDNGNGPSRIDTTALCGATFGKVTRDNVTALVDRLTAGVPFDASARSVASAMLTAIDGLTLIRKSNVSNGEWSAFRSALRAIAEGTV